MIHHKADDDTHQAQAGGEGDTQFAYAVEAASPETESDSGLVSLLDQLKTAAVRIERSTVGYRHFANLYNQIGRAPQACEPRRLRMPLVSCPVRTLDGTKSLSVETDLESLPPQAQASLIYAMAGAQAVVVLDSLDKIREIADTLRRLIPPPQ